MRAERGQALGAVCGGLFERADERGDAARGEDVGDDVESADAEVGVGEVGEGAVDGLVERVEEGGGREVGGDWVKIREDLRSGGMDLLKESSRSAL